jgi:TonB family protein
MRSICSKQVLPFMIATAVLAAAGALLAQDTSQDGSEKIYSSSSMKEGVTPPRVVYSPNPEYTDRARKKKIRGYVVISLIVTPEGTVRDATVTTSLDKELDKQALAAVSTWKFDPATKDGKPVAFRVPVEVSFKLY